MSISSGTKIGPYEVVGLLGAGGMGEVYRGRDSRLGRDVALKVLPPAFSADAERMSRFQREAQMLASLNHPHIAALYGLEDSNGTRALVMELIEGPTLEDRMRASPLTLEEALPIARQIAEALEAAHERGIIHRDLKPANVKLAPDGTVKVLDFGLAKALDPVSSSTDSRNSPTITTGGTTAGAILGTAAYMSPEQAKGKPVDRRADIWAFGVVLLEMLTARTTYSGETAAETLAAVIFKEPSFEGLPPDTPASIRKLLRRCLEKDPRRRLQAIGEARITIEEAGTDIPAEPQVPAAMPVPVPPRRTSLIPWIVAGAALVSALALGFLYFRQTPPPERVLRYSIASPEKSPIHTFAVSPDSRYLVIAAGDAKRQLFLRPLDALAVQPIRGTENAIYPFWSPDSRWIGFFADGKLKKVAVEGGPPQTLCDAPDGRGGTWNRDGVIVFAPSNNGGLQRVAAVGGVAAGVTKLGPGQIHRFPLFLPDGNRFLYLVTRGSQELAGVHVTSLDGQPPRKLLADQSSVLWQPTKSEGIGYLLFARQTTLMAKPLDAKTLEPTGDLFPIAEQVSLGPHLNHLRASVSTDGVLAYWEGSGGAMENQLGWYDRSGKALGSAGSPLRGLEFALSPDQKIVAMPKFASTASESDLWLRDLARGSDTRFTFHASSHMSPVWSPDGRRIVFSSDRERIFDLFIKDTSGAGQDELLLKSPYIKVASDWSRDGRFLLYSEISTGGADLWVLPDPMGPAANRKPVPFLQTEFVESQGQFSPDGRWIAYASNESGRFEIYVRPFPASAGKWKVSINGGQLPRWRGDGRELYYLAPDRQLMATAVKASPGPQPAFEAAAPQVLFPTQSAMPMLGRNFFVYAVSPDGKRFLINTRTGEAAETPLTVVVNWLGAVKK